MIEDAGAGRRAARVTFSMAHFFFTVPLALVVKRQLPAR